MNLSAQDHQAFFICDADNGKPDYESTKLLYTYISIYIDYECYFYLLSK